MKRILLLASALLLLFACTDELDQVISGSDLGRNKTVFHASTEGPAAPKTKVYADSKMKVLWNEGDQISIFNKITYNHGFEFDGEDGDTAGGFTQFTEISSPFVTWADLDNVYAVYPYSTKTKIDNEGVMTVTLPSEQTYKVNSFGIGANTMVAVTDDRLLMFKNVGGYLSLRLYGEGISVSRITIRGNDGEKIAGKAKIEIPLGGMPTVTMTETATDAVTLICDPPVALGSSAEAYTDFWFVLPPITFEKGFTITVTDDKGGVFEKETSKSFTVTRNQLDWMSALKVVPLYEGVNIVFEDANFKAYCVENFDKNGDGEVSTLEANDVEEINVFTENITSLSGIEAFKNLLRLYCYGVYDAPGKLTSLDLSGNPKLMTLHCYYNQIDSLNLSENVELTYLECHSNRLKTLDLSNKTKLISVTCYWNSLEELNITNCTALTEMGCYFNNLSRIAFSGCGALTYLDCSYNKLEALDISLLSALTGLRCDNNLLTVLDLSENHALRSLRCSDNQLNTLDVSSNENLEYVYCINNPLTSIYIKPGQSLNIQKPDSTVIEIGAFSLEEVLDNLLSTTSEFLEECTYYNSIGLSRNDSVIFLNAIQNFAVARKDLRSYIPEYNPDREYFMYCSGFDETNNPIMTSVKYEDLTFDALRLHQYEIVLDDAGNPVTRPGLRNITTQFFNSVVGEMFLEDSGFQPVSDWEAAMNADNYRAYCGFCKYIADPPAVVLLSD